MNFNTSSLALMGLPGGTEWIILLVIILLLFGGKKIPELLRGVGKGVGELQKGVHEGKKMIETSYEEEVTKKDEKKTDVPGAV
ncbi:MAG: twin-arginine translocase TatA/TatE family subunit [Fimbriimonadaceae bacterium]